MKIKSFFLKALFIVFFSTLGINASFAAQPIATGTVTITFPSGPCIYTWQGYKVQFPTGKPFYYYELSGPCGHAVITCHLTANSGEGGFSTNPNDYEWTYEGIEPVSDEAKASLLEGTAESNPEG